MYPPPDTEDIEELRQWSEEFFNWINTSFNRLGGWDNLETTPPNEDMPPDANLVLHYKLDEATGVTAVDTQGVSNGTLVNPVGDDSEWVAGAIGNGLDIINQNPYPYLNSNATWQTTLVDSFSISMWFKADDGQTGANNQFLFGSQKSGAGDTLIGYINQYGALTSYYKGAVLVAPAGERLSDGAMADYGHVVFVFDQTAATTATFRIYYNSSLIASADKTSITFSTWSSDVNLFFGSYNYRDQNNYLAQCFDGPVDEIRIYNKALTAKEVLSLYDYSPHPTWQHLIDTFGLGILRRI